MQEENKPSQQLRLLLFHKSSGDYVQKVKYC